MLHVIINLNKTIRRMICSNVICSRGIQYLYALNVRHRHTHTHSQLPTFRLGKQYLKHVLYSRASVHSKPKGVNHMVAEFNLLFNSTFLRVSLCVNCTWPTACGEYTFLFSNNFFVFFFGVVVCFFFFCVCSTLFHSRLQ